jgi:hypothetical protein
MNVVVIVRRPRGKGLRSKAAKRRKHVGSHNTHIPKHDPNPRGTY